LLEDDRFPCPEENYEVCGSSERPFSRLTKPLELSTSLFGACSVGNHVQEIFRGKQITRKKELQGVDIEN
jgi:hypothetical protein